MTFANCKSCRKPFAKTISSYCDNCAKIEEEEFLRVRDFLYANTHCDVSQVSKATGVPARKIMDYIRNGRIGMGS